MKKVIFFIFTITASIVMRDACAGTYVSGSFSTMMGSNLSWDGSASTDQKYYLIDCSKGEFSGFCTSIGGNLKWAATDKQTVETKLNKKMMFSGAFGYFDNRKPYRFEVEYLSLTNTMKEANYKITHGANITTLHYDFSGDTFKLSALMGNAYYQMKVESIKPYVGFGVGYISGKLSFVHADKPVNIGAGFGFQFMLGVEVPVQKGLYIGAEFRHLDFGMLNATDSYTGASNKLKKGDSSGLLLKVRFELDQEKSGSKGRAGKRKMRRKKSASRKFSRDDYYY